MDVGTDGGGEEILLVSESGRDPRRGWEILEFGTWRTVESRCGSVVRSGVGHDGGRTRGTSDVREGESS